MELNIISSFYASFVKEAEISMNYYEKLYSCGAIDMETYLKYIKSIYTSFKETSDSFAKMAAGYLSMLKKEQDDEG